MNAFHVFTLDHDDDDARRQVAQRNPQATVVVLRINPQAPLLPTGWVAFTTDPTVPRHLKYVEIEGEGLR